ncbi:MAG: hypothetical protein JO079_08365, partial [Frankiaceae bacterium]|nr:hypothetical protein [Frankiaceae bacterium]
MRARIGLTFAILAAGLIAPWATAGTPTAGTVIRVSVGDHGQQGNGWEQGANMSADGRYVVFCTYASNAVSGDTNGNTDVFVRDVTAGTTKLVSAAANGAIGNGGSCGDVMTPDGRYVAFGSQATNLVASPDTNGQADVFVKDLVTGA